MARPLSPCSVDASTDSDITVRPGSPSSSPRAASHTPDDKHADTSRSRRDSHSPRRPTVSLPEPSSATTDKPKTLKRPKPRSRSSSPVSLRDTTPEPSTVPTDSKTSGTPKPREKKARVTSPTPSPPPPSSRTKNKEPATDYPPMPLVNGSSNPTSTGPLSPDLTNYHEPVLDDELDEEPATRNSNCVPVAKQCEIDAVSSDVPAVGPRIDPDTDIAVDETLIHADEGFYDECADSHYQIFIDTRNKLRPSQRPYNRFRTPGSETHSLVQRGVVRKTIRVRRRAPKRDELAPEAPSVPSSAEFVWGSPSTAGPLASAMS